MNSTSSCPACDDAANIVRLYDLDVDEAVVRVYGGELNSGELTRPMDAKPVLTEVAECRNLCPDCKSAARSWNTATVTAQDADFDPTACGRHTAAAREQFGASTLSY